MDNLTMQWGSRPVLDRVSLTMQPGERLAVVGPSGAGKSTVLRLLAGLQLPTSGQLRLFGENQDYLRLDQTNPPDVRLVFQNPALLASLTVEENVGFLLREKGTLSNGEIRERVETCLEAVGLYEVAHLYPGELSGGMQKRVSFARALIDDPQRGDQSMPLLLYDEPTAGLDPVACTRIEDLIVKTTTVARLGGNITGIDASEKNIKIASLHGKANNLEINYLNKSPEQLKEKEKFDIILNLEVVEHVDNLDLYLQSCKDLLKKNGLMFTATINRTLISYLKAIVGAEYVLRWLPIGTHDWNKFVKPEELEKKLTDKNFKTNNIKGLEFNPIFSKWKKSDNLSVNYIISSIKN